MDGHDAQSIDYAALAAHSSREQFIAASPHPFLLSLGVFDGPPRPAPTLRSDNGAAFTEVIKAERKRVLASDGTWTVLPVKKVQPTFPRMITVGRARNNDLVVPHPLVSKLHAYFSVVDGEFLLADAGSANGTRLGSRLMAARGTPERVHSGERVAFGMLGFLFLDAASLWAALHLPASVHP
jgi:hypothetical protein